MSLRQHRGTVALTLVLALFLGGLAIASFISVPFVTVSPGPVFDVLGELDGQDVVVVEGRPTYPTDGTLDVTTVYENGGPGSRLTLLSAVRGWLDPDVAVYRRELLYPEDTTGEERKERSVEEMETSQQTAVAAALRYLDLPVREVVVVQSVFADTPAEGELRAGDQFVRVDGVRIRDIEQVRAEVSDRDVGDPVDLVVRRGEERVALTLVTAPAPDDPERPAIGVAPGTGYTSPISVAIELGNVGGPSAGLVFSLAVVDKLTPGALIDGQHVAGTGTVAADGTVGSIGGVRQKIAAARDAGATVFLVPADNCPAVADETLDGVQLVRVATVDGAVRALTRLSEGDTDLPGCAA